ncbi:MAG: peptide ABC transporter substrate-binding protein [Phycisphaerales bacterium]|nr:MAG: peptide ABC transporter substrate-binding protein [Phycisphaerales bacterium]
MKLIAPFLLLVLALAAVVYLDDTPPGADFVFVNRSDAFTLDPQRMSYIQDFRLAHALYEGLVRWNNEDFSILPAVADLPEVSPDGLTYTFSVKPQARWSNGDPVTAHDFIYSWRRAVLPDTAADYSNMFFLIRGAEEFFRWRSEQTAAFTADPFRDLQREGVVDERTVARAAERLEALLAGSDLPAEIALPDDADRPRLRSELMQLIEAADRGPEDVAGLLPKLELLAATLQRLDEPTSRAAEARWMWRQAESRFEQTVGLRALGDRTLQVTLARPCAYFLDLASFGVFCPVHRPTVEGWIVDEPSREGMRSDGWHAVPTPPPDRRRWLQVNPHTGRLEQKHNWTKPESHVGNGPYVLARWRYKRDMRLEKNPLFHDAANVRCDSILALVVADTNTSVLAFESGRLDWLTDVNAEYQADMLAERAAYESQYAAEIQGMLGEGLTIDEALAALPPPGKGQRRNIHVFPTFGVDFYSFNCRDTLPDGRPNPFALPAVRKAFALSVDKRAIVEQVTRLNEPVLDTLIPPGSIPGYEGPEGLAHDPEAARAELAATGWSDRNNDGLVEDASGRPFPTIDLLYTTNTPRYKWISLELKAQWEKELGVKIDLRGADTKFFKDDLIRGQFMIARGNWYGDYGDPTTFLNLCRTTDGNNDRKYSNPVVDELLDKAELERDPARRMSMLRECERIIFEEEPPMVVICQLVQVYMYEPGEVKGLSRHPRLTQFLWQIEVDKP